MIEIQDVSVAFPKGDDVYTAVSGVTLTIQQGEIFGIIGHSGAGKSTLVRTLNHLQAPSQGQVKIQGKVLANLSNHELRRQRQKIGMIFQHFHLMNGRTVFENVALALKNSQLSKSQIHSKVTDLLTYVGIADKATAYPTALSGGQKQRVAIARALANDPDILLCDEATSALDPQTTQEVLQLLERLNIDLGLTIVVITHEMDVIKRLCHRVAIMDQGRVIETGSILDIFTQAKASITQDFIQQATQLDRDIQLIQETHWLESSKDQSYLLHIRYRGDVTGQPIIADLARHFKVQPNILHGQIELLQGTAVGSLLLGLTGEQTQISLALDYLSDQGVQYSIIQGGQTHDMDSTQTHS